MTGDREIEGKRDRETETQRDRGQRDSGQGDRGQRDRETNNLSMFLFKILFFTYP